LGRNFDVSKEVGLEIEYMLLSHQKNACEYHDKNDRLFENLAQLVENCTSPSIIRMIRKMRWAVHVARIWKNKTAGCMWVDLREREREDGEVWTGLGWLRIRTREGLS
jgi:hypothetical protein